MHWQRTVTLDTTNQTVIGNGAVLILNFGWTDQPIADDDTLVWVFEGPRFRTAHRPRGLPPFS